MRDETITIQTDHGCMTVYRTVADKLGIKTTRVHGDAAFWRLLGANCRYSLALLNEQKRQGVN